MEKPLEQTELYGDGPTLLTLKLIYDTFGVTPVEVKQMPEHEAQLLARYSWKLSYACCKRS